MVQVKFTIDFNRLTKAVMQSDRQTMMKSLTMTVFNAYMEIERDFILSTERLRTK